jgi:hypothetical protein
VATVFYANGLSLTAKYSSGGKTGNVVTPTGTTLAVTADGTALSGSGLVYSNTNDTIKFIEWPGRKNTPNGRTISVGLRHKPGYSGAPTARRAFWSISLGGPRGPIIELTHETSGNANITIKNETATLIANAVSLGAYSPTSGTWDDLLLTFVGTNAANGINLYKGTTLLGSATATGSFTSSWTNEMFNSIILGASQLGAGTIRGSVDEFWISDGIDDPNNMSLVSGPGSLGTARASLLNVSSFDGSNWTALSADKIVSPNTQTQAGVLVTGTSIKPAASDVKSGVNFGAGETGTYDPYSGLLTTAQFLALKD